MGRRSHTDRVAAAAKEVELSRQRLAEAREQVVEPLKGYAERNSFASLVADGLFLGRKHHHEPEPH